MLKYIPLLVALVWVSGCADGAPTGTSASQQDATPESPDADLPDSAAPACAENEQQCSADGDAIEICVLGGWRSFAQCPPDQRCADGLCVSEICEPDCGDRRCGDDGCGERCGDCEDAEQCDDAGQCVPEAAQCGDGVCGDGETCGTCSADCGQCCGDAICDAEAGEDCATCLADCACEDSDVCNAVTRLCEGCAAQCDGRECGDDGCGGSCGGCEGDVACVAGLCEIGCEPACADRECGDDGCGGPCGECAADEICTAAGACAAPPPACGDGVCGDDEDCATCAADCGECCGNGVCGADESCVSCAADCGCGPVERCEPDRNACVEICVPQCNGRECGEDGCGGGCGDCAADAECVQGACVQVCVPRCNGLECGDDGCGGTCGACVEGEICDAGRCESDLVFCECAPGDVCLDGICRGPAQLCDDENPVGLCEAAFACFAGECTNRGAACSDANPTGVCQLGEICRDAACVPFDGAALCDDGNACTADTFDHANNRCVHRVVAGPCDDGNGCTQDACEAGVCVATPIARCIEPPALDPFASPTNINSLTLGGSKPAGASIRINGQEAVSESPDSSWSVDLNLLPGENVFEVVSFDQGEQSAAVVARIVYDIDRPTATITPAGGQFLQGVTVTVTSSEPATVYYTLDGQQPTEWSRSFRSVRQFRIFDDTQLRVRALDDAGNWHQGDTAAQFEITGEANRWQDGRTVLPEALTLMGTTQIGHILYVVGGTDGLASQARAHAYDTETGEWSALAALPIARSNLTAVALDGRIYAIGGEDQGLPLNLMQALLPGGNWENRAPMPSTRFGLAAAELGGRIYVFGGKTNGGVVLPTLEIYDPVGDNWINQIAQMPRPRYGHRAVAHAGLIYLVGGEDGAGLPIAEVDIYDPAEDVWSAGPALPTPRSFVMAGTYSNVGRITGGVEQIIVAGGRLAGGAATPVVEALLVGEDRWVTRSPMRQARHSAGSARIDAAAGLDGEAQLWVVGGLAADQLSASTRYFTHDQDYTRRLAPLPEGRFQHSAQTLNDRIYLFGGRNFQESTDFWRFDPETETYEALPDLPSPQRGLVGASVGGRIYAIGGANNFNLAVPFTRAYDPSSHVWAELAPMLSARSEAAVVTIKDQIWVLGGDNNGALQSVEIYDTKTDTWRAGPVLPVGRRGAMATAYQGEVVLVGGVGQDGAFIPGGLILRDGVWVDAGFGVRRSHGVAIRVLGRQLSVFGGRGPDGITNAVWSVNMASGRASGRAREDQRQTLALDFVAGTLVGGDIYLLGGNDALDPGPAGQTAVQKLAIECFNGVQDPLEAVGVDHGGRCPMLNLSHFVGVNNNVASERLDGWRECYRERYSDSESVATLLERCSGARIVMGCRRVGADEWQVLAEGPREDVFRGSAGRVANGVRWYFSDDRSMGFAPAASGLSLRSCDILEQEGAQRLCWHTSGSQISLGYRCGGNKGVAANYERAVFTTDDLP